MGLTEEGAREGNDQVISQVVGPNTWMAAAIGETGRVKENK